MGDGSSEATRELLDINGDGLPDIVKKDGAAIYVAFNLGYSFAAFEEWGAGKINYEKNENFPLALNIGFNDGVYGYGGGLSLSGGNSYTEESYMDINGDGLPDRVEKTDQTMMVCLNTGAGFSNPVKWQGAISDKHISDTVSVNLGQGLYFTIPIWIPFTPAFVILNPGADASQSMGRHETVINDVNGDGLPDHVMSSNDGEMEVALNQVGYTNKLKKVIRPLGASFELSYERDGNTYAVPQSRWILTRVEVDDGQAGDGVDKQVMAFQYSDGYYNRFEREFYGYSMVVTRRLDPAQGNALYMSVTQNYRNDSYYTKGLLELDTIKDAGGNLFSENVNTYQFFDVHTQSDFIDVYPNNAVATVFPQLIKNEKYFYEGESTPGACTYKDFEYDEYGNVTRFFDAGNAGADDDVEALIEYYEDTGRYIVGKADVFRVYGNGLLMRHREADYETATGNLLELRQYLGQGQVAKTNLEYYANGNLKQVTGPRNINSERYSVWFAYDSVVNTHITKITDSFGYTSEAEYNYKYGVETISIDINNNQMVKEFDQFGRLIKVFAPYDEEIPAIEFAHFHEQLPARAVTKNKIHFDPADGETIDTVVFIDGLSG